MIKTERLLIRQFCMTDAADLEADQIAQNRSTVDYFYAVVLKSTGKMIGHLFFNKIEPSDFMTTDHSSNPCEA